MNCNFNKWLASRNLDAQQWTPELRRALRLQFEAERRHLTTSQRAMVASKLADMKRGTRTDIVSNDTKSMDDAAKQLNVGRATVARAKQVQERGTQITDQPQRLVHDLRGCQWPARVYRCPVV